MDRSFLDRISAVAADSWEFKLLLTVAVVVIALLSKWLSTWLIVRRIEDPTVRIVWRQILGWFISFTALLVLAWVWFEGIGGMFTILTLVAAAMTIVHKELVLNLSSWSVIAWRGLFALEDIIVIGGHTGKVKTLGPLYFTISEMVLSTSGFKPTGRTIRIPNMQVLLQPIVNHAGIDVAWVSVEVKVPFQSDWKRARELFYEAMLEVVPTTRDKKKGASVSISVNGANVQLTGRFPCTDGSQIDTISSVTESLLDKLQDNDITPS